MSMGWGRAQYCHSGGWSEMFSLLACKYGCCSAVLNSTDGPTVYVQTESEGEEDMDYMHEDEAEVAADAAAAEAAEAVPAVPAPTVAVPTPAGPNSNANGAGPSSRGTKRQHRGG